MQLLTTKELGQLRPILRGGDVRLAYRQLLQLLGDSLTAQQLFAEPLPLAGKKMAWYSAVEGNYQTMDYLPLEDRQAASRVLAQQIQSLKTYVAQYEEESTREFLNNCLEIPDWRDIFVAYHHNSWHITLVQWGFLQDKPNPQKGILDNWIQNPTQRFEDKETSKNGQNTEGSRSVIRSVKLTKPETDMPDFSSTFSSTFPSTFSPPLVSVEADKTDKTHQFTFDMGKKRVEIQLGFSESRYAFFSNQLKYYTYYNQKPDNWEQEYYQLFVNRSEDKALLMQLIQVLKTEQAAATDKRSLLEYVVTFVQRALSYDFAKLKDAKREQRYPYETLYLKKGVCEDKAILLSKLLILLDYKVVLLLFPQANHIAVGLQVPQENAMYRYEDAAYCYVESTDITPIGHIPNEFMGGTRIETPPVIIPLLPNGKKAFADIKTYTKRLSEEQERYGDAYFYAAAEGKKLAEAMYDMRHKMEQEKATGDIDQHNNYVKQYNQLVQQYNALNKKT